MITIQDKQAFADVCIIIQMMPQSMREKINPSFINFLEQNKDEGYKSYINKEIPLKEQKLTENTRVLLALIYRDYLCSDEERKEIIEQEKIESNRIEKELKEKYEIKFKEHTTKEKQEEKALVIKSEVKGYAKFNIIRYSQVWEDADILLEALKINEKDNILSIASAGENALAMLTKNPNIVYAIDINTNQIACTELKKYAYKYLEYDECMKLLGVMEANDRINLYKKIQDNLSEETQKYFYENIHLIKQGIINTGKFENYFHIFGKKVLPLIHNAKIRKELLEKKTREERIEFYNKKWNNVRWRLLFKIFFSKTVMGRLGRDKTFFRYVKVNVSEHILEHTKYAITELDTSDNSYLHYIINGKYDKVLPVAYRKENFNIIKNNIDKLVLYKDSIETFLEKEEVEYISKYNLSDIFEYMDDEQMCKIYEKMKTKTSPGAIIAYWNMLADKRISKYYNDLEYKEKESEELYKKDKAFFYSKFIIEEVKSD